VNTSVSVAGDFWQNQSGRLARTSNDRVAWFRPRGVQRNSAHPSFSRSMGRM